MKIGRYIVFLLLVMFGLEIVQRAQGAAIVMADLPYMCDFEDEVETANWVLNPAINTIYTDNRWVIGKATAYTGEYSMYVSQDGGETQTYASTNNVLLAYRDITLEAGDYDVAYDWKGTGNKTKGYLKVVYGNRPTSGIKCLGNATEPAWVGTAVQMMGSNSSLVDGDTWYHVQARVTIPVAQANKTTTRLFFVWVNTDVTVKDSVTSVAIDNFQLAKASPTGYPTNIHVATSMGSSTVTWDGEADEYEVMYRRKGDESFTSLLADGTSVTIDDVDYGAYEFWICSRNGEDKSVYTVFPTVYLYETDCFDALNMYNAAFEVGIWKYGTQTGLTKEVKGDSRVDFGPADIRSRHTTHFDRREVDPRTVIRSGNDTVACLYTVPEGEFGSVRLGNWNKGSEYESVTFRYTVESNSTAVLLIHYAMVLENPDHTGAEQPRFTLDVLDEEGNSIDSKCASVDFHAPTSKEWQNPEIQKIWHTSSWGNSSVINWQDWKTIGISVADYVGQTLTITLTSYDCEQGGHFGYAYFTLNCSRSDVDGIPWGDEATQQFTAPAGFDYAWFNRKDVSCTDTLSRERVFQVDELDPNDYICHATYPSNPECGFFFEASAKPHNPLAELDWRWTPADCNNGFVWYNRCHIGLTNRQTGMVEHRYDMTVENCKLLLEDGTEQTVGYPEEGTYVAMPDEGGVIRYGICANVEVNHRLFTDTAWYELLIPAIAPVETHLYDTICRGEELIFPEGSHTKLQNSGEYLNPLKSNVTGCDSTVIMHLHVHEVIQAEMYDTICPGGIYPFNGRDLTRNGKYTSLLTSQVTGCDSLITLWLTVAQRPVHSLQETTVCADQLLHILTSNGDYIDSMAVSFASATATPVSMGTSESFFRLDGVRAGAHEAVIYTWLPWCDESYTDTVQFFVNLPSSVIEARFDDVLTFLSPEYNGGYTFSSYQWYADGQAIDGANGSWYYLPGLDQDVEFTVLVTLADGTEVWVCPFTFRSRHEEQDVEEIGVNGEWSKGRKILRDGQLIILIGEKKFNAQGGRIK